MSAQVLEIPPHLEADLAILKVTSNISSLPPPLPTGFASPGDPVLMVGHPGVVGTWVVTLGEVLSADGWGEGGYLADLSGLSGNSGSPVANRNGEVIGVYSGSSGGGDTPDPYPFEILLNLEGRAQSAATIESGTEMAEMIERHR
jgi:S1-C subfamily serine protease